MKWKNHDVMTSLVMTHQSIVLFGVYKISNWKLQNYFTIPNTTSGRHREKVLCIVDMD